jgi:hypothetical protein
MNLETRRRGLLTAAAAPTLPRSVALAPGRLAPEDRSHHVGPVSFRAAHGWVSGWGGCG